MIPQLEKSYVHTKSLGTNFSEMKDLFNSKYPDSIEVNL
jgi:hypothetical protein